MTAGGGCEIAVTAKKDVVGLIIGSAVDRCMAGDFL